MHSQFRISNITKAGTMIVKNGLKLDASISNERLRPSWHGEAVSMVTGSKLDIQHIVAAQADE